MRKLLRHLNALLIAMCTVAIAGAQTMSNPISAPITKRGLQVEIKDRRVRLSSISRADLHISQTGDGELLLTSRQDGMIRMLVADSASGRVQGFGPIVDERGANDGGSRSIRNRGNLPSSFNTGPTASDAVRAITLRAACLVDSEPVGTSGTTSRGARSLRGRPESPATRGLRRRRAESRHTRWPVSSPECA